MIDQKYNAICEHGNFARNCPDCELLSIQLDNGALRVQIECLQVENKRLREENKQIRKDLFEAIDQIPKDTMIDEGCPNY